MNSLEAVQQTPYPQPVAPLKISFHSATESDLRFESCQSLFADKGPWKAPHHPEISKKLYLEPRNSSDGFFKCPKAYETIREIFSELLEIQTTNEDSVTTCSAEQHDKFRKVLDRLLGYENYQTFESALEIFSQQTLQRWFNEQEELGTPIVEGTMVYASQVFSNFILEDSEIQEDLAGAIEFLHRYMFQKIHHIGFSDRDLVDLYFYKTEIRAVVDKIVKAKKTLVASMEKEAFTVQQIELMIVFLLFSAQESTSFTLQAMIFQLAKDPEMQEEIYQEIINKREKYSHHVFNNLNTLQEFFKETLRLYPPVPFIPRTTAKDVVIKMENDVGEIFKHFIAKDTQINHCPGLLGRDPSIFPDQTDKFIPRRHRRSLPMPWYPFGAPGSYACPGQGLARLKIKGLIYYLISEYKISSSSSEMPIDNLLTLKTSVEIFIKMEKRKQI